MTAFDYVIRDGFGIARMIRPDRRNPFDAAARSELGEILASINGSAGDVRALLVCGSHGVFSAGGDLADLKRHASVGDDYWRDRMRQSHHVLRQLLAVPVPVIAVVDGPAYGAGLSLAAAADIVLVSGRARFCASFLRLGLVPDFGALYTLPRAVGLQRAKHIALSTAEFGADEALAWGLAMEKHGSDAIEIRAREIAGAFTGASATVLAMTKAALNRSLDESLEAMLSHEVESQVLAFSGTSYPVEAISRQLERRAALFQWPDLRGGNSAYLAS